MALLAVLTDRALLSHIARFQRGLPLHFVALRTAHIATLPDFLKTRDLGRRLWEKVLRDCELRLVQKLYYLASLPEYEDFEELKIADMVYLAAAYGRLDILVWLDSLPQQRPAIRPWRADLCFESVTNNHHHVAQWLVRNRPEACVDKMPKCLASVAFHGDLALLQKLLVFAPGAMTSGVMDAAAAGGHVEMLQYLQEQSAPCTTDAMDRAAAEGRLEVVRFLHVHRTEGCTTNAMDNAAMYGYLDIVQFLHAHRTEGCTTDAMDNAACDGRLDIVHFLAEKRTEGCTTAAINNAASLGHLAVVEYLHTHRTEGCTDEAIESAAVKGHVKVVQYLHEKLGLEISSDLVTDVLDEGRLEVIRYFHESVGIHLGQDATDHASQSGNTELMEYVVTCMTKK